MKYYKITEKTGHVVGMKSVDASALEAAAKEVGAEVFTVGDAIKPGKVDQATRSGYLAGVDIAK